MIGSVNLQSFVTSATTPQWQTQTKKSPNDVGYLHNKTMQTVSNINNKDEIKQINAQNPNATSKKKLTTLQKTLLGVAAGAVIIAGLTVAIISRKMPKFLNLPEHLEYFDAKTIEEAVEFARKTFGIKLNVGDNLSFANAVNNILIEASNLCKGKIALPKILKKFKLANTVNGDYAASGTMRLSEDIYGSLKYASGKGLEGFFEILKKTPHVSISKELQNYLNLRRTLFHELGHANHAANSFNGYSVKNFGNILDKCYDEVFNFFKKYKGLMKEGKPYALTSPAEFVAETFQLLISGVKIPDSVMTIYKKYGGYIPNSFNVNI